MLWLDAQGHSGGLLAAWNLAKADLRSFATWAGLLLEGKFRGLDVPIRILNVYDPYNDRQVFWEWITL